jgi:hypothetical protein
MLTNDDRRKFPSDLHANSEQILLEDFYSIVDPNLRSSLTNLQERVIPSKPISLTQNKKLVALWYEVKNHFEQDQCVRSSLSLEEQVEQNSKTYL